MDIPAGFTDTGRRFRGGPVAPIDAQVVAHNFAHMGYFFRVVRMSDRQWAIFTKPGRTKLPRCCVHKRSYVREKPKILWKREPISLRIGIKRRTA